MKIKIFWKFADLILKHFFIVFPSHSIWNIAAYILELLLQQAEAGWWGWLRGVPVQDLPEEDEGCEL